MADIFDILTLQGCVSIDENLQLVIYLKIADHMSQAETMRHVILVVQSGHKSTHNWNSKTPNLISASIHEFHTTPSYVSVQFLMRIGYSRPKFILPIKKEKNIEFNGNIYVDCDDVSAYSAASHCRLFRAT